MSNMNTKKWIAAIAALLVAVIAVWFLSSDTQRESDALTVAYAPYTSNLPVFVAEDYGIDDSLGLDLQLQKRSSSREMLVSAVEGQVDVAAPVSLVSILGAASRGSSLKISLLASEAKGSGVSHILVQENSQIGEVGDLKGKSVGTYTSDAGLASTRAILRSVGIKLEDIEGGRVEQLPPTEIARAITNGQLDAAFLIEPFATSALMQPTVRSLIEDPRSKYITSPYPVGGQVFTIDFVEESPVKARQFHKIILAATEYIQNNPQDAMRSLEKWTNMSQEVAKKSIKAKLYVWEEPDEPLKESTQRVAELMREEEAIAEIPNLNEMWWDVSKGI